MNIYITSMFIFNTCEDKFASKFEVYFLAIAGMLSDQVYCIIFQLELFKYFLFSSSSSRYSKLLYKQG